MTQGRAHSRCRRPGQDVSSCHARSALPVRGKSTSRTSMEKRHPRNRTRSERVTPRFPAHHSNHDRQRDRLPERWSRPDGLGVHSGSGPARSRRLGVGGVGSDGDERSSGFHPQPEAVHPGARGYPERPSQRLRIAVHRHGESQGDHVPARRRRTWRSSGRGSGSSEKATMAVKPPYASFHASRLLDPVRPDSLTN